TSPAAADGASPAALPRRTSPAFGCAPCSTGARSLLAGGEATWATAGPNTSGSVTSASRTAFMPSQPSKASASDVVASGIPLRRTRMKLSGERLESLYTTMVKIRRFDERTVELFNQGLVKGTAHSYVGEEAVATGACANLREDDYIVGTHRGHGHCIAKGASVD